MQLTHGALKGGSAELAAAMAAARSARNLETRRQNEEAADSRQVERHRRRRKLKDEREFEALMRRRFRVRCPLEGRPRIANRTARKLFHRAAGMLEGTTGLTDARGPDGLHSLHFGFVARGFASTKGRRWRSGEAERAARYIVREEGLEGGEFGWWSNIADDRTELVAFFRAAEEVERHDRKNANVYCTEIIALPAELSARQRRRAVKRICRFFEKRGLAYVAAVHVPDAAGDQRNFHCHIIYSLRPCQRLGSYDWSFAVSKEADINTPDGIAARRRTVVRDINATLNAAGIDKRYTHLSNKARRMETAQPKVGQSGIWILRRLATMEAREALLTKVRSFARGILDAAAELPERRHVLLYMMIALSTLGRSEAILELNADQQIRRNLIFFNPPGREQTRKYRSIVPIAPSLAPWLDGLTGRVIRYRARYSEKKRAAGAPDFFARDVNDIGRTFEACLISAGETHPELGLRMQAIAENGKPIWLPPRRKLGETDPRPKWKGIGTPNTLRHTTHTFMAARGVPKAQIDTAAGHSTDGGTGDKYNHLRPDYLKDFIAAVESFWDEVGQFTDVHRQNRFHLGRS